MDMLADTSAICEFLKHTEVPEVSLQLLDCVVDFAGGIFSLWRAPSSLLRRQRARRCTKYNLFAASSLDHFLANSLSENVEDRRPCQALRFDPAFIDLSNLQP
jgi:hypothetical protein